MSADPTAIATIAPVESFFDFFLGAGGSSEDGDGAGEGKNELLQGGKGSPQRLMFPENADTGNEANDLGIEPFRLLFETFSATKLAGLMLGSWPEKALPSKKSPVSWVKLLMANGSEPEKSLRERSKRVKRVNSDRLGGNTPENLLSCK